MNYIQNLLCKKDPYKVKYKYNFHMKHSQVYEFGIYQNSKHQTKFLDGILQIIIKFQCFLRHKLNKKVVCKIIQIINIFIKITESNI